MHDQWSLDTCSVFVLSTDPRAAQAGFERWRSRPELESGRETCSAVFPVDVDTLFTLCFTNSKFMKEFREERKTFGEYNIQYPFDHS